MLEWDIYVEVVSIPGATGAQESDLELDKQQPGGTHVLSAPCGSLVQFTIPTREKYKIDKRKV